MPYLRYLMVMLPVKFAPDQPWNTNGPSGFDSFNGGSYGVPVGVTGFGPVVVGAGLVLVVSLESTLLWNLVYQMWFT